MNIFEQGLTRREFVRRGGIAIPLVVGTPILAACGAERKPVVPTPAPTELPAETAFFTEIANLSIPEQVKRVDDFYGKNLLTPSVAVNKVVPIWARAYIQAYNSTLTPVDLAISSVKATNPNYPGGTSIDFLSKKIGPAEFDYTTVSSNADVPDNSSNEVIRGIVIQRSGSIHEMTHVDTKIVSDDSLKAILDNSLQYKILIVPNTNFWINGFQILQEDGKRGYQLFHNFDEISTDLIAIYISQKIGVTSNTGYLAASTLFEFFNWIGYPRERFIDLHRRSDFRSLANDLASLSYARTGKNQTSLENRVLDGVEIIRSFENDNAALCESFFPGVKDIWDKPRKRIR